MSPALQRWLRLDLTQESRTMGGIFRELQNEFGHPGVAEGWAPPYCSPPNRQPLKVSDHRWP